jgi:predicted phosphoadenosine phosphosulfate sulfurtransferase
VSALDILLKTKVNGMKIYLNKNVYEAALQRINRAFDEFDTVMVSTSGGKDSTVITELAIQVAKERGRLPLKLFWLDQECELQATVDYVKQMMYRPEIEPWWYQIPFRLQNATSANSLWLNVWGQGEKWVREKDPISRKENTYGSDRFRDLMTTIIQEEFKGKSVAVLTGLRAEESHARFLALTLAQGYKDFVWQTTLDKSSKQFLLHPIYDWTYTDIWKAIQSNNWQYNNHYNNLYRIGTPILKMRVSNYFHETAVHSLFTLQEIEPETYHKATQRISGLDAAAKFGKADYFIYELPFMFQDWREYRDYLLNNLIKDEKYHKRFQQAFASQEKRYQHYVNDKMFMTHINSILANDVELTKLKNWESNKLTMKQQERYKDYYVKVFN